MGTALLAAKGVSVQFPGTRALDGATVAAAPGDVVAVIGANGSGKTTLLRVLCGVQAPTEGTLESDGETLRFGGPRDALARGIALVPQEPEVAETLPAWENILLGRLSVTGRAPGRAERERARQVVAAALPDCDPDAPAGILRKADRAVLALIRAIECRPRVLALDEPTAVLGEDGAEVVAATAKQMQAQGGAVILVSHRIADVLTLATRIVVLVDGHVVLDKPRSEVAADEIVERMAGPAGTRAADAEARPAVIGPPTGEPVLRLARVRGRRGLNVDKLELRRGEVLGVAGLSGSGRSRLCAVVAGSEKHDGEVLLDGRALKPSRRERVKAGVGFVPEDRVGEAIFPSLSVERNVEVANVAMRPLPSWAGPRPRRAIGERLREFAVKAPSWGSPITALSGGNQQLVVLTRVLGAGPKVLVADEPTQGVDQGRRTAIHAMLRAFCAGGGAMLLVMSDFEELLGLASRVVVMRDGELVAEVAPDCDEHHLIRVATGVEQGIVPAALAQEAEEVGRVR